MENNKQKNEPLKRHESLKELSRDHYFGLLLCRRIDKGLQKNTDPARIKRYTDYFWREHLLPHFIFEEKVIFPLPGEDNPLVQQALEEHRRLQFLFEEKNNLISALRDIVRELEHHIRFEERVLFKEIQESVPSEQLNAIMVEHAKGRGEKWPDPFWE